MICAAVEFTCVARTILIVMGDRSALRLGLRAHKSVPLNRKRRIYLCKQKNINFAQNGHHYILAPSWSVCKCLFQFPSNQCTNLGASPDKRAVSAERTRDAKPHTGVTSQSLRVYKLKAK